MDEAYELCDEIIIMDHGKIIAQGTPKSLLAKHFNDVILQLPKPATLPDFSNCRNFTIQQRDNMLEMLSGDVNSTIQQLLAAGLSLDGLRVRERTLDDLFLELTGKEIRP
jgi:ABC-2 type transport system ATP-binding protein